MIFFHKAFFIGIIAFLCCNRLSAQADSLKNFNDTGTLETVTVTAFGGAASWKDAPAALALISKTQLQRFDNKTLVPVFNAVAGVRMEERSPGSYRLSVRGSLLRSPFGVRNIKVYWNTDTDEVLGDKHVTGVRIKNNKTGELTTISINGFFVAIGHQPNSDIFKPFIDMDEAGYIKTIPGTSKTNVEGVFASGDVQDKIYRQAVTAAGSCCMAALDAERYLSMKGIH